MTKKHIIPGVILIFVVSELLNDKIQVNEQRIQKTSRIRRHFNFGQQF